MVGGAKAKQLLPKAALAVWAVGSLLLGANLLAFHTIDLPQPSATDPRLKAGIAALPETPGRWRMTHFLYASCRCSAQVAEHLVHDVRRADILERIVWVGPRDSVYARLAARYPIEQATAAELEAHYGVTAVPFLIIEGPTGALAYTGGYGVRKQSAKIEDQTILARLEEGQTVSALPIFGCAVSAELKQTIDPLGLADLARMETSK